MSLPSTVERFSGNAETYDAHRPRIPDVAIELLVAMLGRRPQRVIDLGCGTGLSTHIWSGRAEETIGIDPNPDMLHEARRRPVEGVHYVEAFGHATGLPDACADIVTAAHALHWMEPEPTIAEVTRLLKPGGIFATFSASLIPTMRWEAEVAYRKFHTHLDELFEQDMIDRPELYPEGLPKWRWADHRARMEEGHRFTYIRELEFHSAEEGSLDRLLGLATSYGAYNVLRRNGFSDEALGLEKLREEAGAVLGDGVSTWWFGFGAMVGVSSV